MTSYEKTEQPVNPEDLGIDIFGSKMFPALYVGHNDYATGRSFTIGATANR